jgi:copper chaperone CopZ
MKKYLILVIMILTLVGSIPLQAQTLEVQVSGMVCAFCAQGIEKKFSKVDGIDKVHVDLKSKKLTLDFKGKPTLSNQNINDMIKDAGYQVKSIKVLKE